MKRILGWLLMMCLMAACGDPDQGPPLGVFAAIAKKETDPAFNITPPSSRSPAQFTYTSSNAEVATIAGSLVTIKGPGTSTITASQDRIGGYGPTSGSTTLTVSAVACDTAGNVRIKLVCVPCVAPAVATGGVCVAPATNAVIVHANDLAWMGVSHKDSWTNARDFCATITLGGASGPWKLPSQAELAALQKSGAIDGHGWSLGPTWSSTAGAAGHVAVDLSSGAAAELGNTANAYVSCVR
ncbi:hypothetical protein ACI48D_01505 [Massilia sp. LXY-6]|uniref:hypothetical protein n=1 Tax=Massilia sp. LXY-6 TaxID=3379823 RepID=UPI003EE0E81D